MKVLALVTDAYGGYGGIAQYNRDLIGALASLPEVDDVQVLPRIAPEPVIVPPKVMQHPPLVNRLQYSLKALMLCLRHRPDVIFNGHVYHGPLARRLASLVGARLVSQLHGTEVWEPLVRRLLYPLILSETVLCVSRDTETRYYSQSHHVQRNAKVLHNTVRPQFTPGDFQKARQVFDLEDEIVIVTVSRLDARDGYKGHDRVMRALPRLIAQGMNVAYLIAGVGEDQERLVNLTHQLGVERHVRFLGKVGEDLLPDLYRAADIFALPSTGEGFGIVFLEAMACGTPAIGLAVGGVTDALIVSEWSGAVSAEEFEEKLVHMIARVRSITEHDRTDLCGTIQSHFGADSFTRNVRRIFT